MEARATRNAAFQFEAERGHCPSTHDELVRGGYLDRSSVRDPWGTNIVFLCASWPEDTLVFARSAGPDRIFDTADDVSTD